MRSWDISGLEGGTAEDGFDEEVFWRGAIGLAFEMAARARAAWTNLIRILRRILIFCYYSRKS